MDYQSVRNQWKQNSIKSHTDLDKHLDNFRILFAYHSGKIENESITYHDTREIFANNKILNFTGDPRTLFEIQNQKLCYEFLKDKIITKEPLSIELVKDVHRILTAGTYDERRFIENGERPGEFKKHDYITGLYEVGAFPDEVPELLGGLIDEVNHFTGDDHILVAAYFHANFENIHPFADGNGRVGRTLMNYYLMIHDEPPTIIYDEDKALYYKALQAFDLSEELEPLKTFLMMETIRTWERSQRTQSLSLQEQLKRSKQT